MAKLYSLLREKMSPEARKKSEAMTGRMLKKVSESLSDSLEADAYTHHHEIGFSSPEINFRAISESRLKPAKDSPLQRGSAFSRAIYRSDSR